MAVANASTVDSSAVPGWSRLKMLRTNARSIGRRFISLNCGSFLRRSASVGLPSPVHTEPVEDKGTLVILTPERFTAANPAHVALARDVSERLARAGLPARPSGVEPARGAADHRWAALRAAAGRGQGRQRAARAAGVHHDPGPDVPATLQEHGRAVPVGPASCCDPVPVARALAARPARRRCGRPGRLARGLRWAGRGSRNRCRRTHKIRPRSHCGRGSNRSRPAWS